MNDDAARGALLGIANGIAIALLFALGHHADPPFSILPPPWFLLDEPTRLHAFLGVAMHTVPVGILWGALLGRGARDLASTWGGRSFRLVLSSWMLTTVSAIPWPSVVIYAWLTAFVFSIVLGWWITRTDAPWIDRVLEQSVNRVDHT